MKDVYGNTIEREEVETIHLMMPCEWGCIHSFLFFPVRRSLRREGYRQTQAMARKAFGKSGGRFLGGYGYEDHEIRKPEVADRLLGKKPGDTAAGR